MPVVRKKTFHQKKKLAKQLETENQCLRDQLSQLQNLQQENPNPSHSHTIKDLSRKQGNLRSRLNGLRSTFSSFRKNKNTPKTERERERESNVPSTLENLKAEREQIPEPQLPTEPNDQNAPPPLNSKIERATSPILPKLSTREESSIHPFTSDSEPDTPTTLIGDEPSPTDKSLLDHDNLTENLERAEGFIKILQTELDYQEEEYHDYQFRSLEEIKRLRYLVVRLENQLKEKNQTISDLSSEIATFNAFEITFQKVCRQRDDNLTRLGEISYLLELEISKNQINYDTLKSVVLEREILIKKYALAKGKIYRREKKLNELIRELANEEEIVDLKDQRIDTLTEQINKLNSKNSSKQTQIIQLVQQLGREQTKNKVLTKLIKKLKNKVAQLNKKGNKEHNRQRINSLNRKLEALITERETLQAENNSLKGQLTYYQDQEEKLRDTIRDLQSHVCPPPVPHTCSPCSLPHLPTPHVCPIVNNVNCSHADYDNLKTELAEKENIIQQQAQRIRELENKPPVVETKTQTIEKIKEVKKEVEKPTPILNTPFGEDLSQIIEINLQGLEQELNILLSSRAKGQIQKATNYQELSSLRNKEIKSYLEKGQESGITNQLSKEMAQSFKQERIFWLILLIMSLLVIGGLIVKLSGVMHKEKKKKLS